MPGFDFPSPPLIPEAEVLRREVREFLAAELADRTPLERAESWNGVSAAFSRRLGERGWISMTWPKRYGGHERSAFERYVVIEEMLAAGAPVGAHWIADRQSGPTILRFGSEAQRQDILPRIARGECYFCIGMSEPGSGSDLASVRTKAVPTDGGYRIDGAKLWTTNAHNAHYMILLCRTERGEASDRHGGMSQFLIDLTTPGITIRPVLVPTGEHHFNEVVFDNVQVPAEALLGAEGDGWKQVMSELAYERSGPERFLSSFTLYKALVAAAGPEPSERVAVAIGRLAARFITLRRMSRSVAGALQAGADPSLQAAIVKDLGALLEQEIPEVANDLLDLEPTLTGAADDPAVLLGYTMMHAPSFSLRGGTREILRGIIARGLGLR